MSVTVGIAGPLPGVFGRPRGEVKVGGLGGLDKLMKVHDEPILELNIVPDAAAKPIRSAIARLEKAALYDILTII